jgi:hypothetical protein
MQTGASGKCRKTVSWREKKVSIAMEKGRTKKSFFFCDVN